MTCVKLGIGSKRGPQSYLCTTDGPMVVSDRDCPNAVNHTPHPAGYIAHALWADEMLHAGREQVPLPRRVRQVHRVDRPAITCRVAGRAGVTRSSSRLLSYR